MSQRGLAATARRRARARSSRGAAAVEFALILPLLVMLLVGTVTIGLTYSRGIALTDSVREGARFGATADASAPTWATDVISQERAAQGDDADSATAICVQLMKVTATVPNPTGTPVAPPTCSQGTFGTPALATSDPAFPAVPSGAPVGSCVVQVLAARRYVVNFPPISSFSGVMTRGAVTRYERSSC